MGGHCAPSGLNTFSEVSVFNCLCFPFKQNEENKKKNKRAALKAQMDLEEARKAASQAAEQQKNNNPSLQDQEGETVQFEIIYHGIKRKIQCEQKQTNKNQKLPFVSNYGALKLTKCSKCR